VEASLEERCRGGKDGPIEVIPTNGCLLLVDDEELNLDMLSRRLRRSGFAVEVASSGREALHKISLQEFDLVLLDQMMPELSGSEVLRMLRRNYTPEALPVIMVTAVAESDKIAEALEHGANDYITKPIDYAVALARIRGSLARRSVERELRRSEERYALAARASRDGLWDWDLNRDQVYYSPRWQEMLGVDLPEPIASPEVWFSRVLAADQAAARAAVEQHLQGKEDVMHLSYRVQRGDGVMRWMSCRGVVTRDASGRAIRFAGSQSDVTDEKTRDSLTGLANRTRMLGEIESLLEERCSGFAVMFLDLDGFKSINDSLGHVAGDELLRQIARRVEQAAKRAARSLDGVKVLVARMGGDEFAILVSGRPVLSEEVAQIAERVQSAVALPFQLEERTIHCAFSVGIAFSAATHHAPEDVLRDADIAMYASKLRGGNEAVFFSPEMHQAMVDRLHLENDLRNALANQEFFLVYQPIIDLQTGFISGVEALIRWKHPVRGVLDPDEFIPVAEQTGLILEIGHWVLRNACEQVLGWQQGHAAQRRLELSVNISPSEFKQDRLAEQIRRTLEETGFPPELLHLEITEGVLFDDLDSAKLILAELKALGIGLDLDDFGAGHSSLRYLRDMPFDCLKIDRGFTAKLSPHDPLSAELIQTILQLAANLRLDVVAEGIETARHKLKLQQMGCGFGQGYYFSRPILAADLEQLLAAEAPLKLMPAETPAPSAPAATPLLKPLELSCG